MSKEINGYNEYRPILIIANSSWYLSHYRNQLLKTLKEEGNYVMTLSPIDAKTPDLSKLGIHIPWRIHRSTDKNPLSLIISFIRLFLLVRAIKPRIIHSHTLKANLLSSIVSAFFGIPCLISFAGMGKPSKSKGIKKQIFFIVIRVINFFAIRQRITRWRFKVINKRSAYIFQNPIDLEFFEDSFGESRYIKRFLIPGSGIPEKYYKSKNSRNIYDYWSSNSTSIDFYFCGRLLKSKGIELFIELSNRLINENFTVFGGIDPSSSDSLRIEDVRINSSRSSNIKFEGAQKDPLLSIEAKKPILIVPSQYGEGLPRSVAECLALGIPVICSKDATCGIFTSDLLYIAEGNNIEDYINCYHKLQEDYESGALERKITKGISYSKEYLSETNIVNRTLEAYSFLQSKEKEGYLLNRDSSLFSDWLAQ